MMPSMRQMSWRSARVRPTSGRGSRHVVGRGSARESRVVGALERLRRSEARAEPREGEGRRERVARPREPARELEEAVAVGRRGERPLERRARREVGVAAAGALERRAGSLLARRPRAHEEVHEQPVGLGADRTRLRRDDLELGDHGLARRRRPAQRSLAERPPGRALPREGDAGVEEAPGRVAGSRAEPRRGEPLRALEEQGEVRRDRGGVGCGGPASGRRARSRPFLRCVVPRRREEGVARLEQRVSEAETASLAEEAHAIGQRGRADGGGFESAERGEVAGARRRDGGDPLVELALRGPGASARDQALGGALARELLGARPDLG
jgi:hypothetical protein